MKNTVNRKMFSLNLHKINQEKCLSGVFVMYFMYQYWTIIVIKTKINLVPIATELARLCSETLLYLGKHQLDR